MCVCEGERRSGKRLEVSRGLCLVASSVLGVCGEYTLEKLQSLRRSKGV